MKIFVYYLLILSPFFGFTQTSILNEDFSSDSDMTKSDSAGGAGSFFSDGSKDYYGIYSDTEANRDFDANGTGSTPSVANYSGYSGEYLVAEDIDAELSISDPAYITWGPFNTASYTSLLFSLKIGAGPSNKFDQSDHVKLSYSTDNSNWDNISGGTSDQFLITNSYFGKYLRIKASYTDGLGTDETIYGNFTDPVHGYSNQSVVFPKQDNLVSLDIPITADLKRANSFLVDFISLDPAFILEIHKDLNDLFLFFLSLNAYCKDLIFDCLAVL